MLDQDEPKAGDDSDHLAIEWQQTLSPAVSLFGFRPTLTWWPEAHGECCLPS